MTGIHAPCADEVPAKRWRKSSFSGGGNNCVEVAEGVPGSVPVRDSKDPHGPALLFTRQAFADFLSAVKSGELCAAGRDGHAGLGHRPGLRAQPAGRRLLVRNGYHQPREVATSAGVVEVRIQVTHKTL